MRLLSGALIFIAAASLGFCQAQPDNRITLARKKGRVFRSAGAGWQSPAEKSVIPPGATVMTGAASEAVIAFGKKAILTVGENTTVRITAAVLSQGEIRQVKLTAARGKIWTAVEKLPAAGTKFEVETPNAVAGVRGTVFSVSYDVAALASRIACVDGEVGVASKVGTGSVVLRRNMATVVVANKPPIPPQALEEKEQREWQQWKESIPFSEMGIVGGIAEINAIQSAEAARLVREMSIAKKGSEKVLKDFEAIENAILLYYADTRAVPRKLDDIMKDPGVPGWRGPYLGTGTDFMDPYGRKYFYRARKTPRGKDYIELRTGGLIGAAGDTYGEETKQIFLEELDEMLKQRTGPRAAHSTRFTRSGPSTG